MNEKCIHEDICEFSGSDHCSSDLKICPYYLPNKSESDRQKLEMFDEMVNVLIEAKKDFGKNTPNSRTCKEITGGDSK